MRTAFLPVALAAAALVLSACDTNDDEPGLTATTRVSNIAADPNTGVGSDGRPTGSTGRFTFYSLRENKIIANSDSASTKWDIAFRAATIMANQTAGAQGGILVRKGAFAEITAAPDTVYAPSVSGSQWYTYANAVVTPTPGRTLVVKTADGKYAKIQILSYYKDQTASTTDATASRYYTFDFVLQNDGTTSFQ